MCFYIDKTKKTSVLSNYSTDAVIAKKINGGITWNIIQEVQSIFR